ncbi:MAG: GreA/GreB family elongation factor [Parvularculaceae bacterium]|nr:GreA/GreB family elongation factor [Parvularculaceae bacterium]
MSHQHENTFNKPAIYITNEDYAAISRLVAAADETSPGAALLADEIDRATRVRAEAGGFVRLGSCVVFKDLTNDRVQEAQLTLPKDADISAGRISVLAPVGASLIGLTEGSRFQWIGADGRIRELEILSVDDPDIAA